MFNWYRAAIVAVSTTIALTACGGSGDSGNDAGPSALDSAVRVTNVRPQRIETSTPAAEQPMLGVQLLADVTGDLNRLSGQTIYVLVEDSQGLFEFSQLQPSTTGKDNSILLRLKSTLGRSGTVEGQLKFQICIDIACKSPLGNSPQLIPYKITVIPGVTVVGPNSLRVEVPFGTTVGDSPHAPIASLPLTLNVPERVRKDVVPPISTTWTSTQPYKDIGSLNYDHLNPGQTTPASLDLYQAPIGTYTARMKLLTSIVDGVQGSPESTIDVQLIVTDSGQRMLYRPSTLTVYQTSLGPLLFSAVAADGALYTQVSRIAYSENSGSVQWLSVGRSMGGTQDVLTYFGVSPRVPACGVLGATPTCLMPGTYTAAVYLATSSGVEAPIPYTIKAVVTP